MYTRCMTTEMRNHKYVQLPELPAVYTSSVGSLPIFVLARCVPIFLHLKDNQMTASSAFTQQMALTSRAVIKDVGHAS